MPDDYGKLDEQLPDNHSFEFGFSQHDFTELLEDQGCGNKLSSSRLGLLGCNIVGWSIAILLAIAGVKWNMSWVGTPISAIIGTLATADAGAYFASRWGNRGRCDGEGS